MKPRELQQLIRKCEDQGWRVKETRSGWILLSPNGVDTASVHKTPSDHRADKNFLAKLKRYGVKL